MHSNIKVLIILGLCQISCRTTILDSRLSENNLDSLESGYTIHHVATVKALDDQKILGLVINRNLENQRVLFASYDDSTYGLSLAEANLPEKEADQPVVAVQSDDAEEKLENPTPSSHTVHTAAYAVSGVVGVAAATALGYGGYLWYMRRGNDKASSPARSSHSGGLSHQTSFSGRKAKLDYEIDSEATQRLSHVIGKGNEIVKSPSGTHSDQKNLPGSFNERNGVGDYIVRNKHTNEIKILTIREDGKNLPEDLVKISQELEKELAKIEGDDHIFYQIAENKIEKKYLEGDHTLKKMMASGLFDYDSTDQMIINARNALKVYFEKMLAHNAIIQDGHINHLMYDPDEQKWHLIFGLPSTYVHPTIESAVAAFRLNLEGYGPEGGVSFASEEALDEVSKSSDGPFKKGKTIAGIDRFKNEISSTSVRKRAGLRPLDKKRVKVAIIGDSISSSDNPDFSKDGLRFKKDHRYGWSHMFAEKNEKVEIRKYAERGAKAVDFYSESGKKPKYGALSDIKDFQPDKIIVYLGANDLSGGFSPETALWKMGQEEKSLKALKSRLTNLINEISKISPKSKIYLANYPQLLSSDDIKKLSPPQNLQTFFDDFHRGHLILNKAIEETVSDSKSKGYLDVELVDVDKQFAGNTMLSGDQRYFTGMDPHPNTKGQRTILEAFQKALSKIF